MSDVSSSSVNPFPERVRPQPSTAPGRVDRDPASRDAGRRPSIDRASDRVEVSSATMSRFMGQLRELPPVRTELVDRVRAEIADGAYLNDERIDRTVDTLLDELGPLDVQA